MEGGTIKFALGGGGDFFLLNSSALIDSEKKRRGGRIATTFRGIRWQSALILSHQPAFFSNSTETLFLLEEKLWEGLFVRVALEMGTELMHQSKLCFAYLNGNIPKGELILTD